jgi:hypothetical protein
VPGAKAVTGPTSAARRFKPSSIPIVAESPLANAKVYAKVVTFTIDGSL